MTNLTTIWWRDIPAQVQARNGRDRHSAPLADRFQVAIDRAAMRAGLAGSDAYLEAWRRESRECGDDLAAEVAEEVARLEEAYPPARLAELADAGGTEAGT